MGIAGAVAGGRPARLGPLRPGCVDYTTLVAILDAVILTVFTAFASGRGPYAKTRKPFRNQEARTPPKWATLYDIEEVNEVGS